MHEPQRPTAMAARPDAPGAARGSLLTGVLLGLFAVIAWGAYSVAARHGLDVTLREGNAHALPFDDASFDSVVCCLGLCTIPDPARALAEMHRVLLPGGRLLLLDHVRSTWPPVYAGQWLVEQVTGRTAGEYFTRRQLPLVTAAGFEVVETERLKAGSIERVHARKAG